MPDSFFERPFPLGHKQVEGRFVIPSGIRCTHASTIARCFRDVPPVGIVTTKSLSLAPRAGYREPIYARYAPGSYINAVGLANPGAEAFRTEYENFETPANKFLLVSIFGSGVDDFTGAARHLTPIADGFELNMSCPHVKGHGAEIGEDTDLVVAVLRSVMAQKDIPVFVKVSATLPGLVRTVKACVAAGAAGITVTNSIGPAIVSVGEDPILYNRRGGLSGDAIRPLGQRAVEQVREAIGDTPVIIGMGGVGTAEHVRQFRKAGADLFGIGSAVTGMDSTAMKAYFGALQDQLTGHDAATPPAPEVDMTYFETRIAARHQYCPGLFKIEFERLPADYGPGELGGKYLFLTVPGVGEKPFAIFSAAERTIIVRTVGVFTKYLEEASIGSRILLRGPYGATLPAYKRRQVVMVGGGTGTASLLGIAQHYAPDNDLHFVFGARTAAEFYDLDRFAPLGPVHLATDDGSAGYHGLVSGQLERLLASAIPHDQLAFINCGPGPMVHACHKIQRQYVSSDSILSSIEYMTSCGVGICGKCASPSGALTCIDGPFLPASEFAWPATPRTS